MIPGTCPDDVKLESHLYKDLTAIDSLRVRVHLAFCSSCRKRLSDLEKFQRELAQIQHAEVPEGLLDTLMSQVQAFEFPPPILPADQIPAGDRYRGTPEEAPGQLRIEWAFGAIAFLVLSVGRWLLADRLPPALKGRYLTPLADLAGLWDFFASGAWLSSLKGIVTAVRADGISSLKIMSGPVLSQIAGVFAFGGIVTAVLLYQWKTSHSGGDKS